MSNKSDISVVIPCYNSNATIERALDSILNQTLLPLEVILVDDCGQENLLEFIDSIRYKYSSSFRLKVIKAKTNGGAGTSRNIGWDNASGEYIAFLDSDDSWLPNKLESQMKYFAQNSDLVILGANHLIELENGVFEKENLVSSNSDSVTLSNFQYLIKNRFATSTVILKKNIKFRFQEGKRYSEDFLLWNQIVLSGLKSIVMTDYLCVYHKPMFGASGLSSHMSKMISGEMHTYKQLYKENYYSFFSLILLLIFSYLKYIRRLVKANLR